MENDDNILFTAYIEKSLSDSEIESFEKRLNEDPSFADAFEEFQGIYQVLENRFSLERDSFIETIQKANSKFKFKQDPEKSQKKVIPFKPWQMGIAASILLLIGFYIFNNIGQPSYSDYAHPGEIVLTVRSEANSISKEAETTFNSGKYNEAISHFDELLNISPGNSEIQFYKAIALVETDKFEKADSLLQSLSKGNSVYADKALYWQALSRLKQKKYKEAKTILQKIPSSSPEFDKGQKLLSNL